MAAGSYTARDCKNGVPFKGTKDTAFAPYTAPESGALKPEGTMEVMPVAAVDCKSAINKHNYTRHARAHAPLQVRQSRATTARMQQMLQIDLLIQLHSAHEIAAAPS